MFQTSRSYAEPSMSAPSTKGDRLLGVRSLVANRVYDADGNFVGRLEEIVIDARTGCVRHAVLTIGGILGIGGQRFAVPWSALTPDVNIRRCVIDLTRMQLTAVRIPKGDPWLQHSSLNG
jgi:sporulation protein YlmC with PRC-barrel domain